ncbi:MAG: hypothetical protein LBK07_09980 [Tannerella sp.]|nr:hypothetical protein [Tannerella sp.]
MEVITEMISRARNNLNRGVNVMIFWGYLVAATAIANFILLQAPAVGHDAYSVWLLMIPGAVVSYFINRRIDRTAVVRTHIDRIIRSAWAGFGISVFVFWGMITAFACLTRSAEVMFLITPVILTMLGLGEYVTACACRARPMKWIAALFWLGAILCVFPFRWQSVDGHLAGTLYQGYQQLIMAVCMIAGFAVPGHLIQRKQKQSHV